MPRPTAQSVTSEETSANNVNECEASDMNQHENHRRETTERIPENGVGTVQDPELGRRQFLEAAGFTMSLAAIGGCGRARTEVALPFAVQPEGVVPGRKQSYGSTCGGCSAGCGLLVGVRDGRPLKMEGMPEHPLTRGGLCAIGQAMPLGLYDSHRLTYPLADGTEADWETVDEQVTARLSQNAKDGDVMLETSTGTSPTPRSAT